jgi:hypothetical protein
MSVRLKRLVEESQQAAGIVASVATAAAQHTSASRLISENLEPYSQITRETAEGSHDASDAAVAELSRLAIQLQGLAGRFRIGANESSPKREEAAPAPVAAKVSAAVTSQPRSVAKIHARLIET